MTAIDSVAPTRIQPFRRAWPEVALLVAGLAAITLARAGATRAGLEALAVGAGFGVALAALVLAGGGQHRIGRAALRHALLGTVFGLALVGAATFGGALAGAAEIPGLGRPAAPFLPWVVITVVVAAAEEALLRGVLFDRLRSGGGIALALLGTAILFALMHVPIYGWHVVPLDLAVGLALGGLRISTGGITAPAAAHAVADLATWWL